MSGTCWACTGHLFGPKREYWTGCVRRACIGVFLSNISPLRCHCLFPRAVHHSPPPPRPPDLSNALGATAVDWVYSHVCQ